MVFRLLGFLGITGAVFAQIPATFDIPLGAPVPVGAQWTVRGAAGTRSWTGIASSADGMKLAACAIGSQIQTSTDGGATWTARDVARSWTNIVSSADGTKLAATQNFGQVYTSTDSGESWTAQDSARPWRALASSEDGAVLLASLQNGLLLRSLDSGVTWTVTGPSLSWTGVACSADGDIFYAATDANAIYISTNSGDTWSANTAAGNHLWSSLDCSADGTKIFATTFDEQIFVSTNSGTSWAARATAQSWRSVVCSDDGVNLLAIAFGGRVHTSTDSGTTWTARDTVRDWRSAASSADGQKLAAVVFSGPALTSVPGNEYHNIVANADGVPRSFPGFVTNVAGDAPITFEVLTEIGSLFTVAPAVSGDGTLTFTPGNTAGNTVVGVRATNGAGTTATKTFRITLSAFVPLNATISLAPGLNFTNVASPAPVTITFTKPVLGFTSADLVTPNGVLGAVTSSDGGTTWTAPFTPSAFLEDLSNVITLDLAQVTDAASNVGSGTVSSNNYAIDTLPPFCAVQLVDDVLSGAETTYALFTFSEPVTGFTASDLSAINGSISDFTPVGDGLRWFATLEPDAGVDLTLGSVLVAVNGATDVAGNGNFFGGTDFILDTRGPSATISVQDTELGLGETTVVTFTFSELALDFELGDVAIEHGALTNLQTTNGLVWQATLHPELGVYDTANVVTLDQNGIADQLGNPGAGSSSSNSYAINTVTRPVLIRVSPAQGVLAGGTTVTLSGVGFGAASSVTFGGVEAASFIVDGLDTIIAVTPPHAAGPVSVVVTNIAGSNAANSLFTYANAAPQLVLEEPVGDPMRPGFQGWGADDEGQLEFPHHLTDDVVHFSAGGYHCLAVMEDGNVFGWGEDLDDQATPPEGLSNVIEVSAGGYHSLALHDDGSVTGWGYDFYGQATPPSFLQHVTAIATGGYHSLALTAEGTVIGWGDNSHGQAIPPGDLTNVVAIAAGELHSLAVKADGTVVGWGYNENGEISIPVGLTNVVQVAAGAFHSLALKSDGTVVAWGENDDGETNVPAGLDDVVEISGGAYHSLALKENGIVVGWGHDTDGQLSMPPDVGSVREVHAGSFFSIVLGPPVLRFGTGAVGVVSAPRVITLRNTGTAPLTITGAAISGAQAADFTLDVTGMAGTLAPDATTTLSLTYSPLAIGMREALLTIASNDPDYPLHEVDLLGTAVTGPSVSTPVSDNVGAVSATLGGTIVSNGGSPITQRGVVCAPVTLNDTPRLGGAHVISVSLPGEYSGPFLTDVSGLTPGTTYAFAAFATNEGGGTSYTTTGSFTTYVYSGNADLAALSVSTGTLSPAFDAAVTSYTSALPANASTFTLTAVVAQSNASLAYRVHGGEFTPLFTGTASGLIPTQFGPNVVDVRVTAQNGTQKLYTITLSSHGGITGANTGPVEDASASGPGATRDVTFNVSGHSGTVSKLAIQVHFSPRHTAASDLVIQLIGPDGTTATLLSLLPPQTSVSFAESEASSNSFQTLADLAGTYIFTDEAEDLISSVAAQVGAFGTIPEGRFRAEIDGVVVSLDAIFAGKDPNGTWTVRFQDYVPENTGNVESAAFFVEAETVTPGARIALEAPVGSPLPSTLELIGGQNELLQPPAGLVDVLALSSGWEHHLALHANGTVTAWGAGNVGEMTPPAGLAQVTAISAGSYHSLALKSDRKVVAWGYNLQNQATVPAGLNDVAAVAAGGYHSLALRRDGSVVAWGFNEQQQASVPVGLSHVTAIAAGALHNLALKAGGSVVAWGDNSAGQSDVPAGLSGVIAVSAGTFHSVALKNDGTVVAWGASDQGQTTIPAGLANVTAISAGAYHTLALKSDGTLIAWGRNGEGQTDIPPGLTHGRVISAGGYSGLVLRLPGVDFGTEIPGTPGTVRTFTVRNPGDAPLTISSVAVSGAQAAHFAVNTTGMTSPVAAGGTTTFTVTFSPSAAGSSEAILRLSSDAVGQTHTDILLSGESESASADLVILSPSSGDLSPFFLPQQTSYELLLPNAVTTFTLLPVTLDPAATLTVNGTPHTSGTFTGAFTVGNTPLIVTVLVIAEGGATTRAYTITARRETPFQQWVAANGVASNPTATGTNGLSNTLNFAFGLSPVGGYSGPLSFTGSPTTPGGALLSNGQPVLGTEAVTGGFNYRAVFVRRKDWQAAGLTYQVQFSANLSLWQTSSATPLVLAETADHQLVSLPYLPFVVGRKPQFFRVRIVFSP